MNDFRIAWLLPSTWFYWQPVLKKFGCLFPQIKLFTTNWTGFAKGFEDAFAVQEVGQKKFVTTDKNSIGYGRGVTMLSPEIVTHLFAFKPHVIFSNSFGIWTTLALLFKPLGRWRVVIAYEGSSPNVDYRNSLIRLTVRRMMVKATDALITNSQAGKTYLIDILGARTDRVFAQPYEVPVPESLTASGAASDQLEIALKRPVFLCVGKIVPRKGLHLLLQACVILREQGHRDYTVLIIGNGEQRDELEAFCQAHDLQDCVQWLGRIEYDRLGNYFAQADVFVFPTLEDTWGLVVLEAMLFAKPILCSKWAGSADLVQHGENGYVFDPQNVEEIVEVLRRFIDDRELSDRMGQKSKQIIAQYTPEAAAEILAEVAKTVIQTN